MLEEADTRHFRISRCSPRHNSEKQKSLVDTSEAAFITDVDIELPEIHTLSHAYTQVGTVEIKNLARIKQIVAKL